MTIAEQITKLKKDFDEVKQAGYAEGYDVGYNNGGAHGYSEGLAEGKTIGYHNGYAKGDADGYDRGHEQGVTDGKQEVYDAFWDKLQQNGNRVSYQFAFAGVWTADMFRPKYSMTPTSLNTAFHSFDGSGLDMVAMLEELGITLDTSKCATWGSTFMWANIDRLGVMDVRGANGALSNTFAYGNIKTIDKLIVKPENTFTNTFEGNRALTSITIEGTIGNNISFNAQTNLSEASIKSVIDALSSTVSGKTLTLSLTAVKNVFGEDAETEGSAWDLYKQEHCPNWTISLA